MNLSAEAERNLRYYGRLLARSLHWRYDECQPLQPGERTAHRQERIDGLHSLLRLYDAKLGMDRRWGALGRYELTPDGFDPMPASPDSDSGIADIFPLRSDREGCLTHLAEEVLPKLRGFMRRTFSVRDTHIRDAYCGM